jgi:dihydroneopterin aldolase
MDCIELKNMVFYAYHGVLEQERKVGNTFIVNLELFLNLQKAAVSDNLADTLNYAEVFALTKAEMAIPSCLLEHVAGRIVQKIKQTFPQVEKVKIRLAKTKPPLVGEVEEAAVILEI